MGSILSFNCKRYSLLKSPKIIFKNTYKTLDSWSNIPEHIKAKQGRKLFLQNGHPLCSLRELLQRQFRDKSINCVAKESPVVSTITNFDSLGIPKTHVSRSKSDTYYVDKDTCLRTHTSAHQLEEFKNLAESKMSKKGFLITADVYRRDEVDASHYPIFHQMEGAYLWDRNDKAGMLRDLEQVKLDSDLQKLVIDEATLKDHNDLQDIYSLQETQIASIHLKNSLVLAIHNLVLMTPDNGLDKSQVRYRWTYDSFPFTQPSFQLEIFWKGAWLEILGSGVVRENILTQAGIQNHVGWAFGIGLERLAMILYSIPDIRLFWTTDDRFHKQFTPNEITTFQPYSKYPLCYKDISFWIDESFAANDFYELVRDVCKDLVESVDLIDQYTTKAGRTSLCYRINYRSMEKSLKNEDVDLLQVNLRKALASSLNIQLR
ncbi:phenylalanyl-tRNA synthetase [Schizosaccharomyces cryophilus OY26]|uniref:Phenylalanine--tRNA ligase, mitochondrial n=1 Tax=Schizosaccharomyces cryophilus (strain OY26 / ATCC MYA-4695 / CBS 11777 / NBRC 106824 / NRRL Y48691) TaxID=653667 RepID=S9X888_SCHCR|nr:phenylalanyl-tRNA synthetase [Schizosaccharomyces cryophilus OY26]EPY50016.1 phenylalanyl-tRNA synthetase [Schizosaccharomyces cryophilus OY26]